MIGKPEWFTYRIFGWGVRPKTWEGWVYGLVAFLIALGIAYIPMNIAQKSIVMAVYLGILLLDVLHIMTQLDKHHDERERLHQLIIERNCSFAAVGTLVVIAIYQTMQNYGKIIPFDINLMIVLGVMVAVKAITTIYVNVKN